MLKKCEHCFAQTIVLAFKLRAKDKLQLDGFYAGKIEEPTDKVKCTWKENDLSQELTNDLAKPSPNEVPLEVKPS